MQHDLRNIGDNMENKCKECGKEMDLRAGGLGDSMYYYCYKCSKWES